ncbi:MAG: hypothetical protein IJ308_04625 [Clostridia bacterium]|nr:hypothetical protein [Clostridia bacterium]
MKKQNKKLITLLLAGAFCCTAAIGVASLQSVRSFADETSSDSESATTAVTYELTKLFTSGAVVKGADQATLQIGNGEQAGYRNAVALKWFDGKKDANGNYQAQYFSLQFAFADANFTSVTLNMDSASSVASEKGKATNKVKFVKDAASTADALVLDVTVIADDGEEQLIGSKINVAVGEKLTLSLTESDVCKYSDQFEVLLANENGALNTGVGIYKNVGANYAAYSTTKDKEKYPLQFSAETEETEASTAEAKEYKKTQVAIYELNGQSFDGVEGDKVEDTAAPVLVVNEEIKGFMLGAALSWSETATSETVPPYVVIDVLKTSIPAADKVVEYYQYNPTDEFTDGEVSYKKFDFSYKFTRTVYTENDVTTSVYEQNNGEEFVSIRFSLSDSVNKNAEYYLSWYADEEALRKVENNEYIVLNRNKEGAQLAMSSDKPYVKAEDGVNKYLVIDENGVEDYVTEYEGSELDKFVNGEDGESGYNGLLKAKAANIYAGNNAKMQFPTLEGLFYDDNGYRNLSFTICYKTETGSASSTPVDSYSQLELKANTVGKYEVKIFATDKADNKMKFYLDGELVEVDTTNVWKIDAIPTFTYTVNSQGLKIQNEESQTATARNTTKAIGETYSFSSLTVVGGAESQQSEFALFKVNTDLWSELKLGSIPAFTSVNYKEIRETIKDDNLLAKVGAEDGYADYFELYLDVYATKLAEDLSLNKANVLSCFERIEKYNAKITEDDAEWEQYNKYEFGKSSSSSFKVLDDGGVYVMFADYYDEALEQFSRVAGYKVIKAEEKADVIKGETQWLKNNLVSVILFSIAAVMLVLIVILLLIKPSDETLEDVDEQVSGKKGKNTKVK